LAIHRVFFAASPPIFKRFKELAALNRAVIYALLAPMNRFLAPLALLATFSLMGCATKTASLPPAPPPAPAPQAGAAPQPAPGPVVPPPAQAAEEQPVFTETGTASFYGIRHAGRKTASGERFDHMGFTAAHRTLAFGTIVRVTNIRSGKSVKVAINDRGPHIKSRIIDLSTAAAREIGLTSGLMHVRLDVFLADQTKTASRD
jgi:rare lipoprotein A